MKRKSCGIIVFLFMVFNAQVGVTEDTTKIELGKQLFNDTTLAMSTNEKSCNSCHPDGKGIGAIAKGDYTGMINLCIVGALKGQALEKDSENMEAMQTYLQSLVQQ
jgi:cytochrome c peroxidase